MELRHVKVESSGSVARVRLSGSPMSLAEAREIERVFEHLTQQEPTARVVTITSAGADFCPGIGDDLDPLTCGSNSPAAIALFPSPVVVALHGRVASVGLELALAADIRVADATARLSFPDVAAGRLPCWGGTQRLPRAAGRSVATRMLLAGDELDAADALACGLIHVLADDADDACTKLAGQLDALAPLALAAAKEALARGPELPLRHALELEGDLNHLLQTTADRAEGLDAFFAKRAAKFEGT